MIASHVPHTIYIIVFTVRDDEGYSGNKTAGTVARAYYLFKVEVLVGRAEYASKDARTLGAAEIISMARTDAGLRDVDERLTQLTLDVGAATKDFLKNDGTVAVGTESATCVCFTQVEAHPLCRDLSTWVEREMNPR